jgi:hypothetical protein
VKVARSCLPGGGRWAIPFAVCSRAIDYAQDLLDAPTAAGLIKRAEVDAGVRESATTGEAQHTKHLEREVKELRRANEILKLASAFLCPTGAGPSRRSGGSSSSSIAPTLVVEPTCKVFQVGLWGCQRHALLREPNCSWETA